MSADPLRAQIGERDLVSGYSGSVTSVVADVVSLHQELLDALEGETEHQALVRRVARVFSSRTQATLLARVFLANSDENGTCVRIEGFAVSEFDLAESIRQHVLEIAQQACVQGGPVSAESMLGHQSFIVAARVPGRSPEKSALVAIGDERSSQSEVMPALQMTATVMALANHRTGDPQKSPGSDFAFAVVDIIEHLVRSESIESAARSVVDGLAAVMPCRQVALGLCSWSSQPCLLAAVSGHSHVDPSSDRMQLITALLEEAVIRGTIAIWSAQPGKRPTSPIHEQFVQSEPMAFIVSGPLSTKAGGCSGAWLILGDDGLAEAQTCARFMTAAAPPVAEAMHLQQRAQPGPIRRWIRKTRSAWGLGKRGTIAMVALFVAGACFLPIPYSIRGSCELQPMFRRYVAVPFDATLEKSFAEPGDIIQKDQVLARLDGREIRWELSGAELELSRAAKERDSHLANKSPGAAAVAQLEMQRLEVQTRLLKDRYDHLEIRSGVDGLVIAGDLRKAEGVPVKKGQTLFEVAPLDQMLVEVAVSEEDLPFVHADMPVTVHLDGTLHHSSGTIGRIRPRSELRDNRFVFIAEVSLPNPEESLRPGMHGRYVISAGMCTLGWRLFHKPWRHILYWCGW